MELSWKEFFELESKKEYMIALNAFLDEEYSTYTIYPPRELMYNAFNLTPLKDVKVIIIGQDPYHEPNQAMGLSFSVPSGIVLPPSLKNIYKEIENDLGIKMNQDGDLTYLAKQGVLLLNALLTVRQGEALSHDKKGYNTLLKNILLYIDKCDQPIVFVLWGRFARSLKKYITNTNRLILESNHPSPLSANRGGFFGEHHFSKINKYLEDNNLSPINFQN